MSELVSWMQEERGSERMHPLQLIGLWGVVFLEIRPFQDGNGRLSRVLTTLLLLQAGYAYVPYSSLESVIEQNKEAYYTSTSTAVAGVFDMICCDGQPAASNLF